MSGERSQHALVELERTDGFALESLEQACRIIGLGLEQLSVDVCIPDALSLSPPCSFSGKEQWVMRWLLGKLQADGDFCSSARYEPKVWLLLCILIRRIPLTQSAKLLQTYQFFNSLDRSLGEFSAILHNEGNFISSFVTQEKSPSRKRKRSETSSKPADGSEDNRLNKKGWELLSSISLAVWNVQNSTRFSRIQKTPLSHEFLTSILSGTYEVCGRVVGNSLKALYYLSYFCPNGEILRSDMDKFAVLDPFLEIWISHAPVREDARSLNSHKAFSSYCLVPTLLVLERVEQLTANPPIEKPSIQVLEQLCARHILLQTGQQTSFEDVKERRPQSKHSNEVNLDPRELLEPLEAQLTQFVSESQESKTSIQHLKSLYRGIPLLFDIATRCLPITERKRQGQDESWLDFLFQAISNAFGCPISTGMTGETSSHSIDALQLMLKIVQRRKVALSRQLLRKVAQCFSGLDAIRMPKISWSLLAQIITLDADVFLINEKDDLSLLPELLLMITQTARKPPVESSDYGQTYDAILFEIVIPLMQAFARARNLGGFLLLWREQLTKVEQERMDYVSGPSRELRLSSIWEDQNLALELRSLLETSLVPKQILDILVTTTPVLKAAKISGVSNVEQTPAHAEVVLLHAILMSVDREETVTLLSREVELQMGLILSLITSNNDWARDHHWWLWHIITTILFTWRFHRQLVDRIISDPLFSTSLAVAQTNITTQSNGKTDWKRTLSSIIDFLSVVVHACGLDHLNSLDLASGASQSSRFDLQAATILSQAVTQIIQDGLKTTNKEDPNDIEFYLLESTLSSIVRFPQVSRYLSSDIRQELFASIYQVVCPNLCTEKAIWLPGTNSPVLKLWTSLLDVVEASADENLRDDLLETLIQRLLVKKRKKQRTGDGGVLSMTSFMAMPLDLLRRQHREKILNSLFEGISNEKDSKFLMNLDLKMSLAIKFMELSNPSAQLVTEAEVLFNLGLHVPEDNSEYVGLYGELSKRVLGYVVLDASAERKKVYLEKILDILDAHIKNNKIQSWKIGHFKLAEEILKVCSSNAPAIDPSLGSRIAKLQNKFKAQLFKGIRNITKEREHSASSNQDVRLDGLCGLLAELLSSLSNSDRSLDLKQSQTFDKLHFWSDSLKSSEGSISKLQHSTEISFYKIKSLMQDTVPVDIGVCLLRSCKDTTEYLQDFREIHDSVARLTKDSKFELAQRLLAQLPHHDSETGQLTYLAILVAIEGNSVLTVPSEKDSSVVTSIFSTLCSYLRQTKRYPQFRLTTDILEKIVRNKMWSISQSDIETLLSSMVSLTSHATFLNETEYSSAILLRLCRLTNTIVLARRTKIGGRHHLLVPFLQRLLLCLVAPNRVERSDRGDFRGLPPWLTERTESFDAQHANAYTRILSTICEPPVSAVGGTRGRSKVELVDVTRKARGTAGQYLGDVLVLYTQCQLTCRVPPDLRRPLASGWYAILEVIPSEVMRKLNASMTVSQRAVFRTLYQDYRRSRSAYRDDQPV